MKIGFQDGVQKDFQKQTDLNMNTKWDRTFHINFNLDFSLKLGYNLPQNC